MYPLNYSFRMLVIFKGSTLGLFTKRSPISPAIFDMLSVPPLPKIIISCCLKEKKKTTQCRCFDSRKFLISNHFFFFFANGNGVSLQIIMIIYDEILMVFDGLMVFVHTKYVFRVSECWHSISTGWRVCIITWTMNNTLCKIFPVLRTKNFDGLRVKKHDKRRNMVLKWF